MILADLPTGSSAFLDANTLVYHFQPHPTRGPACTELLKRIELQELSGFCSTHVLSEVAHRLMTLEASIAFGWTTKIVERLKQHPTQLQQLVKFRRALQQIPQMGIQVLTVPVPLIDRAAEVSQQTGLLTNDALIIAIKETTRLTNLASSDAHFDRVPWITRYAAG